MATLADIQARALELHAARQKTRQPGVLVTEYFQFHALVENVAERIRLQAEASAANLKRSGADPALVDICLSHFTALADELSPRVTKE